MKRISILIICFLTLVQVTYGQTPRARVEVSKTTVGNYERFTYAIISNVPCKQFDVDFGDLEITGGPSLTQRSNVSIINGRQTSSAEYRTTYELRATAVGNYVIKEFKIKCGGKSIKIRKIPIKVVKSEVGVNEDPNYFMRLSVNKETVYQGEPFIVTLKYFTTVKPASFEHIDMGDAVGIWRQDLNPGQQTFELLTPEANGTNYYTITLRQELCFAQNSGTVTLTPYNARLVFGEFFSQYSKDTYSNLLEVEVKPIKNPDGTNFSGLVGDFKLSADINATNVEIGEAIDYTIKLTGSGNQRPSLVDLGLSFPAEFNHFEPQINELTEASKNGMTGEISYNYTLVPTAAGEFSIPEYSLNYFDFKAKKFKTLNLPALNITVTQPEGFVPIDTTPPSEATTENTVVDIRYIEEENVTFYEKSDFIFGTWTFFGLLLSPILLALIIALIKRRKSKMTTEDIAKVQQKKALKGALTSLKNLKNQPVSSDHKVILKELQQIIYAYFKQQFNFGLSDLSKVNIINTMENKGVDAQETQQFNKIWGTIEMGQFAPVAADNVTNAVNETESFLRTIDKKL